MRFRDLIAALIILIMLYYLIPTPVREVMNIMLLIITLALAAKLMKTILTETTYRALTRSYYSKSKRTEVGSTREEHEHRYTEWRKLKSGINVRPIVEGKVLQISCPRKSVMYIEKSLNVGTYECKAVLGFGGFGVTLLCNDSEGNAYAVKVPREVFDVFAMGTTVDVKSLVRAEERFLREAKVLRGLDHIHIVKLVDFGDRPYPYLVYEYLDGGSLRDIPNLHHTLKLEKALEIALQICYALDYAYRKGVKYHGDLKPENIMFTRHGLLKVCDFNISGLARASGSRYSIAGTPGYAAPEQLVYGLGKPSSKSDVLSLGIIIYEVLSGRNELRNISDVSEYVKLLKELEISTGISELDKLIL